MSMRKRPRAGVPNVHSLALSRTGGAHASDIRGTRVQLRKLSTEFTRAFGMRATTCRDRPDGFAFLRECTRGKLLFMCFDGTLHTGPVASTRGGVHARNQLQFRA